jgi:hypothetical protein
MRIKLRLNHCSVLWLIGLILLIMLIFFLVSLLVLTVLIVFIHLMFLLLVMMTLGFFRVFVIVLTSLIVLRFLIHLKNRVEFLGNLTRCSPLIKKHVLSILVDDYFGLIESDSPFSLSFGEKLSSK